MARINTKEAPPFPFKRPNNDTPVADAQDIGYGQNSTVEAEIGSLKGSKEALTSTDSTFYVVDSAGNVIFRIDSDGASTVDLKVKSNGSLTSILTLLANKVNKDGSKVLSTNDFTNAYKEAVDNFGSGVLKSGGDTFHITDNSGNIIAKFDANGLSVTDVAVKSNGLPTSILTLLDGKADKGETPTPSSLEEITSVGDTFLVTDSNGNIILKVDSEGVHSVAFLSEEDPDTPEEVTVEYVDVYETQGVTAIQAAIAAITDSSAKKQYVVRLHGNFIATQDSDFSSFNSAMNEKSVIAVKNTQSYITIQGDGIDKTIVRGALPNNLGESYAYNLRTLATINGNHIVMKDLTLQHDNGRYVIHTYGAPDNAVQTFNNVRLICPKNTGDAATVWGSKCPYGAGFQNGNHVEFVNGIIESEGSMFLCHDNTGMTIPFHLKFENVKYIKKAGDKVMGNLSFIGTNCKSIVELNNIIGGYGGVNLAYTSSSFVDDGCIQLIGNIGDKCHIAPLRQASVSDQLKISVDDNTLAHTILFDTTSSAFPLIVSASSMAGCVDRFGIKHYNGFVAKDGDVGFSAWCMGMKPVYSSNGLRALGDCSSTSKTLGLIIDGTNVFITLDLDYSSMSNSDILADINSKLAELSIPCTASFYSYGMEFCFGETDNIVEMVNMDSSPITAGHIVKQSDYGFALCTSTADMFGILLDDVKVGGMGRVMTRGFLGRYTTRYYALPKGFNTSPRYGCSATGTMTADANGKILSVSDGSNQYVIFPA